MAFTGNQTAGDDAAGEARGIADDLDAGAPAEMVPVLLMLPAKIDTPPTSMPAPCESIVEMIPALVMLPAKVDVPSISMAEPLVPPTILPPLATIMLPENNLSLWR